MRNTARWAATIGLTATAVCGPLTGSALAEPAHTPASLYAPSALVLTVGRGEAATAAAPERAVTLSCAPAPSGTHPAPGEACAELADADGDFDALGSETGVMCTREYRPVVVTVSGVWQGQRVAYERVFSNDCMKRSHGISVFSF
ncbi:subtilase-type protease inhibitor [Streptomyces sp. NPDC088387]|uniref:subtilase-type protease inhibitor n=1 Tax=Streptomyces sp. NPDC088387 TaxID=3365859 RepID=UPI003807AACF